jgi:hypothetical protein
MPAFLAISMMLGLRLLMSRMNGVPALACLTLVNSSMPLPSGRSASQTIQSALSQGP